MPVQHYSPETDFGTYIESVSESEDESATEEQAGEPTKEIQQALAGRPALPTFPDMPDMCVTRGAGRDLGICVQDIQLRDRCWCSSTYRK